MFLPQSHCLCITLVFDSTYLVHHSIASVVTSAHHDASRRISKSPIVPMSEQAKQPEKPKKKICCACPETKVCAHTLICAYILQTVLASPSPHARVPAQQKVRDECIGLHGRWGIVQLYKWGIIVHSVLLAGHWWGSRARTLPNTGAEAQQCQALIEAHKQCLRSEGFNVRVRGFDHDCTACAQASKCHAVCCPPCTGVAGG